LEVLVVEYPLILGAIEWLHGERRFGDRLPRAARRANLRSIERRTNTLQALQKEESLVKTFNRETSEFELLQRTLGGSSSPNALCRHETTTWDTHSKLNVVSHRYRVEVTSIADIQHALKSAREKNIVVITAGGRHSMGGQQFAHDGILLDMRKFNKVLNFDVERGLIKVESGTMWSDLIAHCNSAYGNAAADRSGAVPSPSNWAIAQKPTGADNISIGGALSSNIHGRGLTMKPIVENIEEFEIVLHDTRLVKCSRTENSELFRLAIGGYGLFGVIANVTLRLRQRKLMKRVVETTTVDELIAKFEERIAAGHEYGDFQFAIDHESEDFLRRGILSTYVPVTTTPYLNESSCSAPLQAEAMQSEALPQHALSLSDWQELLYLAHTDKTTAFEKYEEHYLRSNGQVYYSDTMQLSTYVDDYHVHLDKRTGQPVATEVITELYVPREKLGAFMGGAAKFLKTENADVIYGTVRLIERDDETFLPWAKENFVCIIFNIHTEHDQAGIAKSARIFNGLIAIAQSFNGSYYLTYHRFAYRSLVEKSYPQFAEFLKLKRRYDPNELIQSQWYRHYRAMFRDD